MIGQQYERLIYLCVVAASVLVLVVTAFSLVDASGDAEPSSAERWFSSVCWTRKSALIAQGSSLRLIKPTRIWSVLSTFTNSNAASVMELPVAGWRRLPSLFLHLHRNL